MRITVRLVCMILLLQTISIYAQSSIPKREFRGAWIATVANIDWPVRGASTASQKQALITILDGLKAVNINAIMFQVRPECDALYQSSIEPWSYWLTGIQGQAPNPFYDPLKFAIEETHKRGMELHAWLNPYRVERIVGNYPTSSSHVSIKHPEWTFTKGSVKILDPGIPAVRDYVVSVIMDIVNRYDVDGIHFDDYFYLDGMGNEDVFTFAAYNPGNLSLGDWRRDNVNRLVKMINDNIKALKPHVKWGISPRGIWRPGYPAGITGNDNYNSIYCDAMAWLRAKTIDYINPQLYWVFGGPQDYGKLMPWWADSAGVNNRHMYVGHAVYRINSGTGPFNAAEVPKQIRLNRTDNDCQGSVLYNTNTTLGNPLGFYDSLKILYKNPALPPVMNWKDQVKPNPPVNLRYAKLADVREDGLLWNAPSAAADGETASRYAVYRFYSQTVQTNDLENSDNINNIVGTTNTRVKSPDSQNTMYFAVTSIDRNNNESSISNIIPVQITIPAKPLVFLPADLAVNQRDTIFFSWENSARSNYNRLQVASDINFTNLIVNHNNIVDTFKTVTGFKGLTTYYWRITASNLAGESVYSEIRSFTTGFPAPPQLLLPVDLSVDQTLTPILVWNKSKSATQYRILVADGLSIIPSQTVVDTVVSDSSVTLKKLKENKIYTWSVMASNSFGSSLLAGSFKFKTGISSALAMDDESVPSPLVLNQNYPNPFNPATKIEFIIPKDGFTVIKIYNMLGQIVGELVNRNLAAGSYSVEFSADNLPSGLYVYQLQSGSGMLSRKMILLK
ncbi:MAG: hypothetical protein CVV24_12000 [Ignavibacteriae bacterium HGW-Ignavibacteriae-3]|nr:MAG: hypothetical protein CVV24_12000 [Ignavibacteriae bacterium HGW-Ignavibacteriae-3]